MYGQDTFPRTPFEMFILRWSMSTLQCSMLCSMPFSIYRAVHLSCSGLFWTALNAVWISLTHCRAWSSSLNAVLAVNCGLRQCGGQVTVGQGEGRGVLTRELIRQTSWWPPDNAPTFRSKTFTRKKHWWNIIIPTCFRDNEKSFACTPDKSFIKVNFHTNSN